MSAVQELLAAGRPTEALAAAQAQVRQHPQDAKLRTMLFQLLAVTGQWARAAAQLEVCGELDAGTLAMVNTYREALKCELVREAVFEGRTTPMVMGEPAEWVANLVHALKVEADGDAAGARQLRQQALEAAPATAGALRPPDATSAYEPDDALFETLMELVASVGVHLLDEGFVLSVVETAPRQLSGRSGAGRTGTLGSVTPTYDRGTADRLLLADLAAVDAAAVTRDDAVAELASGLRHAGRAVPIFAVLLDGTPELGSLAALRGMGDPAVAFVGEGAAPEVEDVLGDAGWLCVPFAAGDDPAECWQRALDRQRAVVGHG